MSAFPDEPLLDESETLSDASHSGSEDSETGGVDAAGLDKMMALLGSDADLGFDSQEEEDEEDSEAEGSDDDDQEELEQPAVTSHKGKEKARQDVSPSRLQSVQVWHAEEFWRISRPIWRKFWRNSSYLTSISLTLKPSHIPQILIFQMPTTI